MLVKSSPPQSDKELLPVIFSPHCCDTVAPPQSRIVSATPWYGLAPSPAVAMLFVLSTKPNPRSRSDIWCCRLSTYTSMCLQLHKKRAIILNQHVNPFAKSILSDINITFN